MGAFGTHLCAAALVCALTAPVAARAEGDIPDDPLRFFATCAGRMSALMEHQWIVDGPASDLTKVKRQSVLEVVEALTPPGREAAVMGLRIEAKAAHAALLAATRQGEATAIRRAMLRAATLQRECDALLS